MIVLYIIIIIALVALLAASVNVQKLYASAAPHELKRRARRGDTSSHMVYELAQYGVELPTLLHLLSGLWATLLVFLLVRHLVWWLAILLALAIVVAAFSWQPGSKASRWSLALLKIMSPVLLVALRYLSPVLRALSSVLNRIHPVTFHTGLYEKEDLLELLTRQAEVPDNRISPDELRIAIGALSYSDVAVREITIPRSVVRTVRSTDSIGPILLDELHKSGHSRFPVVGNSGNIVGILYLHDLVELAHGGTVKNHMDKKIFYVHEDLTLGHALQAFLRTKHHLFVVVNEFEEYVGIITIEDILEKIIGVRIIDEFDRYDDLREVAKLTGKKAIAETKATEISSEVVES